MPGMIRANDSTPDERPVQIVQVHDGKGSQYRLEVNGATVLATTSVTVADEEFTNYTGHPPVMPEEWYRTYRERTPLLDSREHAAGYHRLGVFPEEAATWARFSFLADEAAEWIAERVAPEVGARLAPQYGSPQRARDAGALTDDTV